MCIYSGRMGGYYTLSEAVTAALSEKAKRSSYNAPMQAHTHTHTLTDLNAHKPTDTMHIDKMKGTIYQITSRREPEDV